MQDLGDSKIRSGRHLVAFELILNPSAHKLRKIEELTMNQQLLTEKFQEGFVKRAHQLTRKDAFEKEAISKPMIAAGTKALGAFGRLFGSGAGKARALRNPILASLENIANHNPGAMVLRSPGPKALVKSPNFTHSPGRAQYTARPKKPVYDMVYAGQEPMGQAGRFANARNLWSNPEYQRLRDFGGGVLAGGLPVAGANAYVNRRRRQTIENLPMLQRLGLALQMAYNPQGALDNMRL